MREEEFICGYNFLGFTQLFYNLGLWSNWFLVFILLLFSISFLGFRWRFIIITACSAPLTILEETLRQNPVYEGSFIASWMNRIIYLEGIDPQHVVVMDIGFAILVIFSFLWKPLKPAK
jgi:hypothetical protein